MSAYTLDAQSVGHQRRTVRQIMMQVILALLPGTAVYAVLISPLVLINIIIACVAALCTEAAILLLRQRAFTPALTDCSVILAAWLLALCVPPSLPSAQLIIGVVIMVALGKHLFGGLGHNPFNPAMVAFAVLLVSFPVTMTNWQLIHYKSSTTDISLDGITGATPLDRLREIRIAYAAQGYISQGDSYSSTFDTAVIKETERLKETTGTDGNSESSNNRISNSATADDKYESRITKRLANNNSRSTAYYNIQYGKLVTDSVWVWTSIAWLAGGFYLLVIRVISWQIPVSILSTLIILYSAVGQFSTLPILPVVPAMLSGAIILGAFFIATDPVSAAASNKGKLIYGTGIGVFTFVIREYSVYPEGFAFAVLLMNICVPLIDHMITGPAGKRTKSTDVLS